jgi:hypothetical protein
MVLPTTSSPHQSTPSNSSTNGYHNRAAFNVPTQDPVDSGMAALGGSPDHGHVPIDPITNEAQTVDPSINIDLGCLGALSAILGMSTLIEHSSDIFANLDSAETCSPPNRDIVTCWSHLPGGVFGRIRSSSVYLPRTSTDMSTLASKAVDDVDSVPQGHVGRPDSSSLPGRRTGMLVKPRSFSIALNRSRHLPHRHHPLQLQRYLIVTQRRDLSCF